MITYWQAAVTGTTHDDVVAKAEAQIAEFFGVTNIDWYTLDIHPNRAVGGFNATVSVEFPDPMRRAFGDPA